MLKTLLIAAQVDRSLIERVRADAAFHLVEAPVTGEEELLRVVEHAEVLVTRAYNRVTRRVIEAAPRLELIAQATSGIDNIDTAAAAERGITIINLPGVNAGAVAELVIGFMISMTRTVPFYTREVAQGRWYRDDCSSRHEMRHYRLGIVGLGNVGRRVARLAAAFEMRVSAWDPYITAEDFAARGAEPVRSFADLVAQSDILTLHVPLTSETRRMVAAREIAAMPPRSFLINAARGEVLDQDAALAALQSGQLAGLALDVFDPEPPGALPDDPRLITTPHVGGCTHECRSALGSRLYDAIRDFYATR